jgi:NPCBM/NEW2 domain-containing protein
VWILLAALALATAAPADVTATKLDGTAVKGQLTDWQADQLNFTTASGDAKIAAAELLSVQFAPTPPADPKQPIVELVGGTILPISAFQISDGKASVTLSSPTANDAKPVSIPLPLVRSVRLQPLDETTLPQWDEVRAKKLPGDVLVVMKRSGKSLDYMEGMIGKVTDEEVEFSVDDKLNHVARPKVAGLIYYRGGAPTEQPSKCVLQGPHGLRIAASAVRADGSNLQITTAERLPLTWPIADIAAADYSAGKLVYLSDLEPASQSWQPLVGLPAAATRAAQYGQPRRDHSAVGGPLTVRMPDDGSTTNRAPAVQTFPKGLAIRSRSELTYRLPNGYTRLLTIAGIEPTTRTNGNVVLSIYGDDNMLVEASVSGKDAPLPIDVNIQGLKRLRIVVDYGQNLDTGDWLNLCNARIVK